MCARLLSCPLCSQPGFVTLDALRAGLVSVATRPLACPVCNETLLGIDKLTIHLFGHTINANNRSVARGITDVNRNYGRQDEIPSDATIIRQSWNSSGNSTLVCEQNDVTTNEKVAAVSASNLNSARSFASLVINKSSDSSFVSDSRDRSAVSESTKKSTNQMIFVENLSQPRPQRQQFSSQRSFRTNDSSSSVIPNRENFETSVSMVFHDVANSKSAPLVVSSQTCEKENSGRSGEVSDAGIHRRDDLRENSRVGDVEARKEAAEQFSETWIENLLQENGARCSAAREKSSASEEKSLSEETRSNVSDEKKEYSDYGGVTLIQNEIINEKESLGDPQDSSVPRNEEIFDENHRNSPNSIEVLPQLKALRLLATKDKIERCNVCGITVPDRNILILHKQVVHMIDEKDINAMPEELLKNYPCHFCTKIFKNRGSLMVHMRIAHIGYNIGLDAGFLFKNKDSELSCCENGYNCPTCGKNFKKEQHVTQHLKTHEGKQWECDVCSKMFTTKYFLKKHKRLHSGEMPYKCTICDKTFTFQQSYHKHRLYHKDDKPHTCNTCGRSFKELSTLHNHERIHTGEKPFVCETCGKCFRQRVSYLVHRRIHTGVMPYKCVACGKSFRYKVSQRTHKCPVQAEDSLSPVPEIATTNTAPSSSCLSDVSKASIFLQNQEISEISACSNKFILTINTQGQPILARETDVGTSFHVTKRNSEPLECKKVHRDDDDNESWNDLSAGSVARDATLIGEKCPRDGEKFLGNDENDFFTLVMSPLENDLSSPSVEMKHLRLSSPKSDDTRQNETPEIFKVNGTNILQSDLNNAIEGIFRDNSIANLSLETINDESLKQLIYGIDRKV